MARPSVLFLVAHDGTGASSRFRTYQFLEPLRAAGWRAGALAPERASAPWQALFVARSCALAAGVDVVVLQKRPMARSIAVLRRINPRLVYDLDDAIYARPPAATVPRREVERRRSAVFGTASKVRVVTVGNRHLAAVLAPHARRVVVLPTSVDTDRFRPAVRDRGARVVIGWVGNNENLGYLATVNDVLGRLAAELPGRFVLRVVSGRLPTRPPPCPFEFSPWSLAREVEELQGFDVGLMPLPDDEWTRGKCGFKAIQYMSVGAAAVVSPVGANRDVVTHGVDGMWARTEDEWVDVLGRLVVSPELRARLAAAARVTVERRYSLRVVFPELLSVLASVAGGR